MVKGFPQRSKTWDLVKYSLKRYPIIPMEGTVYQQSIKLKVGVLDNQLPLLSLNVFFDFISGLSWLVVMGSTLFIQRWLYVTKALEMLRSLSGQAIRQSKFPCSFIYDLLFQTCSLYTLSLLHNFTFRYAIRDGNKISIHKNFKERKSFKPDYGAESRFHLVFMHSYAYKAINPHAYKAINPHASRRYFRW